MTNNIALADSIGIDGVPTKTDIVATPVATEATSVNEFVKENAKTAITDTKAVIAQLTTLCQQVGDPAYFSSLSSLINSFIAANKLLLTADQQTDKSAPGVVNNNLNVFSGSTADMLKMAKKLGLNVRQTETIIVDGEG